MSERIEGKGWFRVSKINNILRLVNEESLLTKEEAANVYRHPDKIQYFGENGWETAKPEDIGREPIRSWS